MKTRRADRGQLAILLHSHMPYVEGFGTWPFGEEWLFEAMATSYLPLIDLFEAWAERNNGSVATIGITPVLADQLELSAVGERFLRFLRETRMKCHSADIEGLGQDGQQLAANALRTSRLDYEGAAEDFERRGGDLLEALRRLRDAGTLELWTSAATHAVLPLLETESCLRLQVRTGVESHRKRFASWSGGFWLPECAYRAELEAQLAHERVTAFCVDQTGAGDELDQLEPIQTAAGPVAVPIDWRTIELVWNENGYPADPVYRDYHASTVNGMRAWSNAGAPYDRELANTRAREHARDFVANVAERLEAYHRQRGRAGLCVCALDTELLGHWWYEGVTWLDAVSTEAAAAQIPLAKLPGALERVELADRELHESSWGAGKNLSTWDSADVAELRWPAAQAEVALANAFAAGPPRRVAVGAARRAARELLALQSSDWAFMETRRLAADYPRQRVRGHQQAFQRALAGLEPGMRDFRDMPDGRYSDQAGRVDRVDPDLRGLAPNLELSALLEPASPWGRHSLDGGVSEPLS